MPTDYCYKLSDGKLVHARGGALIVDTRAMLHAAMDQWNTVPVPADNTEPRVSVIDWLSHNGTAPIVHTMAEPLGLCTSVDGKIVHGEQCNRNSKWDYMWETSDVAPGEKV